MSGGLVRAPTGKPERVQRVAPLVVFGFEGCFAGCEQAHDRVNVRRKRSALVQQDELRRFDEQRAKLVEPVLVVGVGVGAERVDDRQPVGDVECHTADLFGRCGMSVNRHFGLQDVSGRVRPCDYIYSKRIVF